MFHLEYVKPFFTTFYNHLLQVYVHRYNLWIFLSKLPHKARKSQIKFLFPHPNWIPVVKTVHGLQVNQPAIKINRKQ